MVKKQNPQIGFWERTLTAIAITFLVLGYYKMASSAYAAPYEIFEQRIFDGDFFNGESENRQLDKLSELPKIEIIEM